MVAVLDLWISPKLQESTKMKGTLSRDDMRSTILSQKLPRTAYFC